MISCYVFSKIFSSRSKCKRKSGFLIPAVKNSANSTNYISIPYFSAISQNKDLTFTYVYTQTKTCYYKTNLDKKIKIIILLMI